LRGHRAATGFGPVAASLPLQTSNLLGNEERSNAALSITWATRSIEMRYSFGSAVDTAVDSAVRVSSAIADLAGGRGVDLNALIPQLSTVFDTGRGMASWGQKVEKLAIGSLDNSRLTVVAHYNPKEIQIDKEVPWQQHNSWPTAERSRANQQDDAESNSTPTRSMSVELLFDGGRACTRQARGIVR
jgi:hypothetical protein